MSGSHHDLEEERRFLLRSIEDLDAEHAAGDLSEADHRALRDRYTARTAAVLRALQDAGAAGDAPPSAPPPPVATAEQVASPPDGPRPTRRRRRALVWGALAAFAAAAVVLVVAEVAARLPGQTATGSVQLGSAQQIQRTLAQAQALEAAGRPARALSLYRQVLRQDPTQEQALAEAGWLEYETGVLAKDSGLLTRGQGDEQAAEQADPGAYAPHLYLGSMLLAEGQAAAAAGEFDRFLATRPPADVVQRAWPFVVRADTGAGRAVPVPPPGVQG